jgi:hypothetical protein
MVYNKSPYNRIIADAVAAGKRQNKKRPAAAMTVQTAGRKQAAGNAGPLYHPAAAGCVEACGKGFIWMNKNENGILWRLDIIKFTQNS